MAGPMGVYETRTYPFPAQEVRLMEDWFGAAVLRSASAGAQLLARALGAEVYPGADPEIGFGSVELIEERKEDPVV